MTVDYVDTARRASAAGAIDEPSHDRTRAVGRGLQLPEIPEIAGPAASPMRTLAALRALSEPLSEALSSGDPDVLLAALSARVRDGQLNAARGAMQSNEIQARLRLDEQLRASRRAEEAQGIAGIFAWVGRIFAAIAAAVGTVASVFTGGTSAVGVAALVLTCLGAAGTNVLGVLEASGVRIDGPLSMALGIGFALLSLAGGVTSAVGAGTRAVGTAVAEGARAAANTAANATRATVATIVNAVLRWIEGASNVTAGLAQAGNTTAGLFADHSRADARQAHNEQERLTEQSDDIADSMRNAMRVHQRIIAHIAEVAEQRHSTLAAITAGVGRA